MMEKYIELIKDCVNKRCLKTLKQADGSLKHPFIEPGEGYTSTLWDWDSYYTSYALFEIADYLNYDDSVKTEIAEHSKGCVLNFLEAQHKDGYIPIMLTAGGGMQNIMNKLKEEKGILNQHKPVLCQMILNICNRTNDYSWFDIDAVCKYIEYYDNNQKDNRTGLYFWINDVMIGIDNNPTVFGREDKSSADIYLNSFMYADFIALSELCDKVGNGKGEFYSRKAENLKNSVMQYLYDERDCFFYSADIKVKTNRTEHFHHQLGAFWKVMPLKVRFFGGFLPMTFGMTDEEQNKLIIEKNYLDADFLSDYGIRTLAKNEKMYNTENSSNPSNWLGPVWMIPNFLVFKALIKANRRDLAEDLLSRIIKLLGKDVEESGAFSESYVPETGNRMMHNGFLSWNLLVISMLKEFNL